MRRTSRSARSCRPGPISSTKGTGSNWHNSKTLRPLNSRGTPSAKSSGSSLAGLLTAMVSNDIDGVVDHFIQLGIAAERADRAALTRDLESLMRRYVEQPLGTLKFGAMLQDHLNVARVHRLRLPLSILRNSVEELPVEPRSKAPKRSSEDCAAQDNRSPQNPAQDWSPGEE